MERKFSVKLVRTYKYCPKCTGVMVPCNFGSITSSSGTSTWVITNNPPKETCGTVITTNPPQYSTQSWNHRCDKCGHGENYDKSYPILEYIDDGELG